MEDRTLCVSVGVKRSTAQFDGKGKYQHSLLPPELVTRLFYSRPGNMDSQGLRMFDTLDNYTTLLAYYSDSLSTPQYLIGTLTCDRSHIHSIIRPAQLNPSSPTPRIFPPSGVKVR